MKSRFLTYPIFICCLIFQISFSQQISDSIIDQAILTAYNDPDKAIETANELLKITKPDSKERFEVLTLLSNAYSSKREYSKALDFTLQAIEISKKIDDPYSEAKAMNKIAGQYNVLGIDQKAIFYLDQAEKIISQLPESDSVKLIYANNHAVRGDVYRDQFNCDIAIEYFNKAFEIYKIHQNNPRIEVNMGIMAYNIGSCYTSLGKFDLADSQFQLAINYAQKSQTIILEAVSRNALSEVYTARKEYQKAIHEIESAKKIAIATGDSELERESYKYLALNFLALNDWTNHTQNYNQYISKNTEIKKRKTETINQSISNHRQTINQKNKSLKTEFRIKIFVILTVFLIAFFFWINLILKHKKRMKSLKSKFRLTNK